MSQIRREPSLVSQLEIAGCRRMWARGTSTVENHVYGVSGELHKRRRGAGRASRSGTCAPGRRRWDRDGNSEATSMPLAGSSTPNPSARGEASRCATGPRGRWWRRGTIGATCCASPGRPTGAGSRRWGWTARSGCGRCGTQMNVDEVFRPVNPPGLFAPETQRRRGAPPAPAQRSDAGSGPSG